MGTMRRFLIAHGLFETSTPHLMILDGSDKQRRHSSEQCTLSCVSRGAVVAIEVLTLTIDSRCIDEKSDFLSMEKTRYV